MLPGRIAADISALTFWHGSREGCVVSPGPEGLVFLTVDKDYAATFIDPLGLLPQPLEPLQYRVCLQNPKLFSCMVDSEWEAFTGRGISRDTLLSGAFDSALLLDIHGQVLDVAVTSLNQIEPLKLYA